MKQHHGLDGESVHSSEALAILNELFQWLEKIPEGSHAVGGLHDDFFSVIDLVVYCQAGVDYEHDIANAETKGHGGGF